MSPLPISISKFEMIDLRPKYRQNCEIDFAILGMKKKPLLLMEKNTTHTHYTLFFFGLTEK